MQLLSKVKNNIANDENVQCEFFAICNNVFKSPVLQRCQTASVRGTILKEKNRVLGKVRNRESSDTNTDFRDIRRSRGAYIRIRKTI